jgi:hypothetical protein
VRSPPDAERRPVAGAPTEGLNHSTEPATHNTGGVRQSGAPSWRDLLVEPVVVPPEMLASATLGSWRRANGVTSWSDYARVYLATLLIEEAQRRVLLERLDGIMQFLAAGAQPDQAMGRLVRLVDEYHGEIHREMAA